MSQPQATHGLQRVQKHCKTEAVKTEAVHRRCYAHSDNGLDCPQLTHISASCQKFSPQACRMKKHWCLKLRALALHRVSKTQQLRARRAQVFQMFQPWIEVERLWCSLGQLDGSSWGQLAVLRSAAGVRVELLGIRSTSSLLPQSRATTFGLRAPDLCTESLGKLPSWCW